MYRQRMVDAVLVGGDAHEAAAASPGPLTVRTRLPPPFGLPPSLPHTVGSAALAQQQ